MVDCGGLWVTETEESETRDKVAFGVGLTLFQMLDISLPVTLGKSPL